MNNIILFDDESWKDLLPLCLTRPVADLRVGLFRISEKWDHYLNGESSYITKDYLAEKYPIKISSDNYVINSRWLPNDRLVSLIKNLGYNDALLDGDNLVAVRIDESQFQLLVNNKDIEELKGIDIGQTKETFSKISRPDDIFKLNGSEIINDFKILKDKKSAALPTTVNSFGTYRIFVEEGADLKHCSLNAENGPIYIGKNASIMEGSHIRGPFGLGESSVVKMGSKIYEDCSFGPYCKIGGEISNSVFQGYSNKAHDGYLGNSVIGEWCNLGAGTNSSNLKNNYAEVKLWNYTTKKFENTGSQFCGLIMGDHSKCGINVMFNTGTVVGVSANVFGSGYPRNYIPSYSWGGSAGYKTFDFEKAIELAEIVMKRRSIDFTAQDKIILEHIFRSTSDFRTWENQ